MLSLKELLSSNPPPSAALLAEMSYGWSWFFFFFPFPSAKILHAQSSLWAYSASTDSRATKVWAGKLTCRNTHIQLLRAQCSPGVRRNTGVHACSTLYSYLLLQLPTRACKQPAHGCLKAEGRERRNTNSATLPLHSSWNSPESEP